jgi:hypothetical protein
MKGRKVEGCRVLVIEDEILIALLIEEALGSRTRQGPPNI